MKKYLFPFLVALVAAMLVASCEKQNVEIEEPGNSPENVEPGNGSGEGGGTGGEHYERSVNYEIPLCKGAILKGAMHYVKRTDIVPQVVLLKLSDSISTHCIARVLHHDSLLATLENGEEVCWDADSLTLPVIPVGDSVNIVFLYSGRSLRYGWEYSRQDHSVSFNNEWRHSVRPKTSAFLHSVFSLSADSVTYSPRAVTHSNGGSWWYTYGDFVSDTLQTTSGNGDQQWICVNYPDTLQFDQLAVYYDDYLLDIVTHNGWARLYFLDEFYLGGEMHFRLTRNGDAKRYPIHLYMSH